ncbi:putative GDP-mannose 4,6 dehydratase [Dichotomopilus funicola]|uniref:GDP-mannose 4,6-dehydratase n=1 Tax=Dichotomopilus funicola TaxID=1934379 RepID=A0AAN6ZQ65_9PEZI|nr:putative GDP-mannose 4,6 dehydratase [Dichotomopilus funicola]
MSEMLKSEDSASDVPKTALITGITGQDGSYLAELLLEKGYRVHGLARRNASQEGVNMKNLRSIQSKITIHKGDITDPFILIQLLRTIQPHEIYHLAAQSHVTQSFTTPDHTFQVNTTGTLNLLQAVVVCGLQSKTRIYNAATSELFGGTTTPNTMLTEDSPFEPKSPYAISKLAAYWLVRNYREAHGLWAVNGILFNHESSRRGSGFVTMRIARAAASYALNLNPPNPPSSSNPPPLTLAGINMARDWGHARDYVRAIWMMLQQDSPPPWDMLIATGQQRTVGGFVEAAFGRVGVTLRWVYGPDMKVTGAVDANTGRKVLQIDPSLERAVEVPCLLGDSTLAREVLGWEPTTPFETLVAEMVDSELERLERMQ